MTSRTRAARAVRVLALLAMSASTLLACGDEDAVTTGAESMAPPPTSVPTTAAIVVESVSTPTPVTITAMPTAEAATVTPLPEPATAEPAPTAAPEDPGAPEPTASNTNPSATAVAPAATAAPPATSPPSGLGSQSGQIANGAEVYTLNCARCHAENGLGSDQYPTTLIGVGSQYSTQQMIAELTSGHPVTFGFADRLSGDEIAQVVAYVRATFP